MERLSGLLLRRLLQAALVGLLVGTTCFFLVRSLPGDMAFRIAAGRYGYDLTTAAAAETVRTELGLERPWPLQLAGWWAGLLTLDLGRSLVSGEPVLDELTHALGHSLVLALAAVALAAALAIPAGALAGLRPGGTADRVGLALAVMLRALPAFLIGIGLILLLAVELRWLPAAGHGTLRHLVLPTLTLALGLAAVTSRVARDAFVAVTRSAWFAFARIKGLSDRQALLRHGLRNAAVPVVAYLGVQLVYLVEGVVVVEALFAWPGIGHALVHAVVARDVPMIQGTALAMGLLFVALNLLVDLACRAIDPRRRLAEAH